MAVLSALLPAANPELEEVYPVRSEFVAHGGRSSNPVFRVREVGSTRWRSR